MYLVVKTMKSVSRSLPLRSFALSSLPSRLSLSTNTTSSLSRPANVSLTLTYRQLSTMPPPPKRKWPRPKGGDRPNGGDRANGASALSAPPTPRSTLAQQPKRPRVLNDDTLSNPVETVDVRQMYTTAAGDAAPKPFSDLKNKLHKGLLDGLEKMGFE